LASLASLPVSATTNYPYWFDNLPDTALTSTVYAALNGAKLTAANTDIRPEDALFATNRSLVTLGYGITAASNKIGYGIESGMKGTNSMVHPVAFGLSGVDPISGNTITPFVTVPVGAAPIVFLANNAAGSATASATNITLANAGLLFSGKGNCASSLLDGATSGAVLSPILREPLSGTMNTVQYSVFDPAYDQEYGINNGHIAPANGNINPLQLPCGTSARYRAIGTGEEVKAVQGVYTNLAGNAITNQVGYAFFSNESVGNNAAYKYITVTNAKGVKVDPINATYTTGALPTCATTGGYYSCPVIGGASFPHLRDGSYPAWSVYRMVTDSANLANAQALAATAQAVVNSTTPDFVPFNPQCSPTKTLSGTTEVNDPGLAVYREHYAPSGVTTTPNDGPRNSTNVGCTIISGSLPHLTLGGQDTGSNTEAGGDVGGGIEGPFTSTNLPAVPGYTQTSTH
jgi:hypothetical protein